jgi:hypothetical protein
VVTIHSTATLMSMSMDGIVRSYAVDLFLVNACHIEGHIKLLASL